MTQRALKIVSCFLFFFFFSLICNAWPVYLDPNTGQTTDFPVSRTLTPDSYGVWFDVPSGDWVKLKLYLEGAIPPESGGYICVDLGGEGDWGNAYWTTRTPTPLACVLTQDLTQAQSFSLYTTMYGGGVSLKIAKIELCPAITIDNFSISTNNLIVTPDLSPNLEFTTTTNFPTEVTYVVYDRYWNEVFSSTIPTIVQADGTNLALGTWSGKVFDEFLAGYYTVFAYVEDDERRSDFQISVEDNQAKLHSLTANPSPMRVTVDGLPDGAEFEAVGKEVSAVTFTIVDADGNAFFQTTIPTEPAEVNGEMVSVAGYYWNGLIDDEAAPVPGDYTVNAEAASLDDISSMKKNSIRSRQNSASRANRGFEPSANSLTAPLQVRLGDRFDSWGVGRIDGLNSVDRMNDLRSQPTPNAGDPVNMISGNYVTMAIDLSLKSRLPLQVVRAYNSLNRQYGIFGRGWTCPYTAHLEFLGSNIVFVDWDGSKVFFKGTENGLFATPKYSNLQLTVASDTGNWLLTNPCGPVYSFNPDGKIVASSRVGLAISSGTSILFSYDENARLTTVTNPTGQEIHLTYNESDLVAQITDSTGRTLAYEYNEKGFLTAFTDVLGRKTLYDYDRNGFLTSWVKPDGATTQLVYENGRVTYLTLPNGTTQSFVWDSDNNQVTFTDQIGTSHIYQFDASAVLSAYTVMPANHQPITTEFVATGSLVTEIINPLNQKHRYSYDAEGFMTSSTDPLGNTTLYEWDPITKQRTKIITPLNQRWRFTWSPFGKPVCLTDPLGNKTQYTYDATGALVAQTDQKGRQTKYVFDETSSFIRQLIDASGHISSFTYDGRGNITRAADPLGRTTAFEYDAADRLIKTIAPDGSFVTMEYDFADNLILRRDHLGRETKIEYNVNNQPVLITNPDNTTIAFSYDDLGRKISVIDPLGRETKFEYGPYNKDSDPGRVTKITYPDNVVELFEYDAVGRLISSRDGIGHKTTFEYDAKGQLIAIVDPAGNRLESTYDSVGRLVARKDPLGRITSFEYDRLDRLVKTTFPDGSRNAYSYDSVGNLLSTKDPMGNTWAFKYDALDRLIRSIQPNGASSSVVFDPAGQLLATIDPLKRKNRFSYDVMGRLTTTQNPLNSAWRYEYDSAGRLVATTNPLNKTATATYDIMDRLVAASDYLGRATTMEYDSAGRLIAKTDALGRRSIVAYDARNRIIAETDPEGQTVTFSYDQAGRLVRRTDATNRTWQWEYDSLGRAIASVDPLGNRVAYAYDAAGNQISKTNARNETTQYEYNPRNQLVLVRYPDNTVATFTYDFIGREISRSGPTGYVQKKWDSVGNLLSEKFSVGANRNDPKGWSYSYDLVGNRINAVDPNGGTYAYEYNALNQLSKLDPPGHTNAVQYRYDLTGFMIDSERQGLKSFLQYDPNGRLLDIRHERTHGFPKVIASRRYTYDAVGNPLSMLDEAGKITQYAYNGADWLTSVSYPDGQNVSYDYDESGNRLREITGAMAVSFVYDVAGRMIARASDTFTYDPDGNLVTARENGKETRYSWSSENQLLKVIKDNPCPVHQAKKCRCPWAQAEQEEYSYLPEDWRRVTRKTGSLSFVSFYDGADESHEYVEIPNLFTRFDLMKWCKAPKLPKRVLFREFISGPGSDDMEAVRYHGRDLAILKDGLGSTIAIANTRGYPIARMNYDVWGNFRWPEKKGHGVAPCKETDLDGILERLEGKFIFGVPNHDPDHYGRHFAKVLTPYLFAGRRLDTFSGLYNSRNRYYNPTVGRFMSSDPIGFAGDGNLWAYARSNPARYTDPFGLMSPGDIVTFNVSSLGGLSYTSESLARLTQGFFEYAQTDPLVIALQNQGKQVELEFAGQVMLAGSQAKNNAIITNAMNMIAQSRSYYQNRLCQVNGNRSIYSDIGTNGPFVSLFGNDEDFTLPPLPKLPGYQPLYPETNVLEELENRELQERFEARGDTGNPENFLRMAELAIIFGSLAPGGQGVKAIGQGVKAIGQGGKLLTGPRAISEATRNVARSYSDKVLKRGLKDAVQEINRHKKILKNADPRQIRSITEDLLKHEGRLQSFIEELQRRGVPIDF